eukprot:TRINITY_DN11450_c0_g2_i1.p1 TRINITY_DN11450_c0_g2~~TRINITY_DN11450_c0_g2_i1.p1  ORF type:complete len:530 (+),score=132.26 TRINITY_DN11450_c0_g2_i1:53-1642(+)
MATPCETAKQEVAVQAVLAERAARSESPELERRNGEEAILLVKSKPTDHFKVGDICRVRIRARGRVAEEIESTVMWTLEEGCQVTVVQIGTGESGRRVCVKDETGRCGWISVAAEDGTSILLPAACTPKSLRWEINVGPLAVNREGLAMKPQFKFGGEFEKLRLEAGVSDVRDGLRVTANVASTWECTAEGRSLAELHTNIRFDAPGFQQALQASQRLLEATKLSTCPELAWAVQKQPETLADVMAALPAEAGSEPRMMSLRVQIQAKVGVTARVNLGWRDTQGYHMVGIGGSVSSAIKVGANLFAGIHSSGTSARIVVGISSFTFQYTFPIVKQTSALGTHLLATTLAGQEWASDFLVMASATSLEGLHAEARRQREAPGFPEALDTAAALLIDKRGVAGAIAKHLGLTAAQLQEIWQMPGSRLAGPELLLKIFAEESLAATSEQRLARCATHGLSFQRITVDAQTAVKAPTTILGVLVAQYPADRSARLVLFLGHFTFEYMFSVEPVKYDLRQRAGYVFREMLRREK